MVPRRLREEKENNLDTDSEFYSEDEEAEQEPEVASNQDGRGAEDVAAGEAFHTDPEDQTSDDDAEGAPKKSSYLPAHLLVPTTTTPATREHIPLEQLSKKQRRRRRQELRQDLRRATRGSGVLEAGEAAQVRRGVVGGRVEKAGKKRKRARRGKGADPLRSVVSEKQRLMKGRKAWRDSKARGGAGRVGKRARGE